MKEIKFRIWDKTFNLMQVPDNYAWDGIYVDSLGRVVEIEEVYEGNSLRKDVSDKYALMQYTGLKDKNGVEIYEGDICQIVGSHKEYVEIRWRGEESRYDCWDCDWDNYGENSNWHENLVGLSESNAKELEVIGNVFENKELLNEPK